MNIVRGDLRSPAGIALRGDRPGTVDPDGTEPAAIGIDIGSGYTRIWASGRHLIQVPTLNDGLSDPTSPVRRGRVTDPAGLEVLLAWQAGRLHRPLPAGAVIVACRPVLSTPDDDRAMRQVLTTVFAPSRLLFTASIRAAAIGAGAAPGPLLVADVGAQLTEAAVLSGGALTGTRRADIGIRDMIDATAVDTLVRTIVELVDDLRHDPHCPGASAAASRGLLLVGGGAAARGLAARTAGALGLPVRSANRPRIAAVRGAGLSALAALRRAAIATG